MKLAQEGALLPLANLLRVQDEGIQEQAAGPLSPISYCLYRSRLGRQEHDGSTAPLLGRQELGRQEHDGSRAPLLPL